MLASNLLDLLDEPVEEELLGLALEPLEIDDHPVVSLVGVGGRPLQIPILSSATIVGHGVRLKGRTGTRRTLIGKR